MSARDISLALLIPVIWGYNFVVMKYAVTEVSPLLLVALRFLLAAFPLVFFVARPAVSWGVLVGYATAFGMVKFALLFTAFEFGAPAGLASVVLQCQAIFTAVIAIRLHGERLATHETAGLVLAALGLILIFSSHAGGGQIDLGAFAPLALVLAAAFAWTVANLINKRAVGADPFAFVVWSAAIAAVPMSFLALAIEGAAGIHQTVSGLSIYGVLAVLYLAYPVSILSGAIWVRLVARHRSAMVAPFALLTPCVGLIGGAITFGERLDLLQASGSALVLIALVIAVMGHRFVRGQIERGRTT